MNEWTAIGQAIILAVTAITLGVTALSMRRNERLRKWQREMDLADRERAIKEAAEHAAAKALDFGEPIYDQHGNEIVTVPEWGNARAKIRPLILPTNAPTLPRHEWPTGREVHVIDDGDADTETATD